MKEFVDRVSVKPNRYKVIPENGNTPYHVTLERADEPLVPGTPLNAAMFNDMERRIDAAGQIYVGSGDMPEAYKVQIDPSGEAFDLPERNKVLNEYGVPIAPGANQYVLLFAEIQIYDPFQTTLFPLLFFKKNGTNNVFRSVAHVKGDAVFQVELSFDDDGNMTSALYLNNSASASNTNVANYATYIVGLC